MSKDDVYEELNAPDAIAVVGMAGRFPGAEGVDALWRNVRAGKVSISRFSDEELEDDFSPEVRASKEYVKARSVLENADKFDAAFFGMYPREAALTDPQHRLFLETSWQVLEDAGYDPAAYQGSIGVFAGASMSTYFLRNVVSDREAVLNFTSNNQVGSYAEALGAMPDFLSTRVAYKLDLRGPAINVSTACSTSLLAIAQAVQSLQLYQSDMAIAGGVSVTLPQKRGYLAQDGGLASRDGTCRPFDAEACGTVFGSGVGAVLLKRLEDAIADGDHIYAVIRGVGVNNDGGDKVGFTAPSVRGQASAISQAFLAADVDPATVGFVECHGTATPLGDPIEFEGLMRAFEPDPQARGVTALGSIKANVGHLDAAAGVTSFIKAVLCLDREEIPPLTNYKAPNPRIDLANSPFYAPLEPKPWPAEGGVRRAGVSSFGVGGTNVHILLEEAPRAYRQSMAQGEGTHILPLSARSEEALKRARLQLADYLEADSATPIADVAFTLQEGRRAFARRAAVAGRDREELIARLRGDVRAETAANDPPRVVFMFPGQGAQYPDMGRGLYDSEPLFRKLVDQGAEILKGPLGLDIREILYGEARGDAANHPIRETRFTQPALFLIEYAAARLWMSRGVEPDGMIGHSVGEFVAACLADVMSFPDALRLIALRGRLMQERPAGAMLSVRLSEAEVRAQLPEGLDIAAVNAPNLSVVAGPHEGVEAFAAALEAKGTASRKLVTSHAFHSAMMDAAVAPFAAELAAVRLNPPSRRFASCVTGNWITEAEATDPQYWARHLRACVRFGEGLATVAAGDPPVLIECGPGRTLATFAAQGLARGATAAVVASLPDHERATPDEIVFGEGVGRLWSVGALADWAPSRKVEGRRTSLPTYPFERESHWIEAPKASAEAAAPIAVAAQAQPAAAVVPVVREAVMTVDRKPALCGDIVAILEDLSGETVAPEDFGATFIELGFDSLFLGQVAQKLQGKYGIQITFRQLLGDIPSIDALAAHLDQTLPAEAAPAAAPAPVAAAQPAAAAAPAPVVAFSPAPAAPIAPAGDVTSLFHAQALAMQQLFTSQIAALQGGVAATPAAPAAAPAAPAAAPPVPVAVLRPAPDAGPPPLKLAPGTEEEETGGRFKVYRSGAGAQRAELSNAQAAFIADVVKAYNDKTPGSKAYTAANRPVLADPRAANGFRQEWKDLVYPLVVERAKGSKLWDVDGNEYVDLVNGFGQTAFGHSPDFVVEAVEAQLKLGFPIGPQSPLAGETAKLIADMVGMERVTFCNTGSEAVMAAMRVARTVTGKSRIVCFNNDYHGQFDEVLVRAGGKASTRALPVAPGIPNEAVSNMVVLPYGRPESLEWVRENAKDLAAVIVEPIQSRHPELRPVEFLKGLREITAKEGVAFVFDEVVTGFRVHPGGVQHVFGIKADLATYGKVLGGGMPVGILAGSARFMDALDGGQWSFGDDSVPEVAPTFFAGTFVRHPLVLAAVRACLRHMNEHGPALQETLARRTAALVERLNADFARRGLKSRAETYSSWFILNFGDEDRLGSLFYAYARLNGVHVLEGFPCFLTTAHSDADIDRIYKVFTDALDALQGVGILPPVSAPDALAASAPAATAAGLAEAPLTEPQTEIWMAAQMGEGASCAFNESLSLRLEGALDEAALKGALNDVVARHDILRATFARTGEKMVFAPQLSIDLPVHDLSGEADPQASLADFLQLDACTPFDLVDGPLVRAALVRLGPTSAQLVLTGHHIVCDGWTLNIIVEDLAAFYSARVEGRTASLPATLPYSRYAADKAAKAGGAPEVEAYWLKLHETPAPLAELPTDRPRPAQKTFRGATYVDRIDADLYRAVKKAGGKQGATLFSTLFATLQVLFGRLSGQEDIVLAVPTAGQSLLGDQVLAGHAVNFLPLRAPFDPAAPFASHLKAVQAHTLEAFDRQDFTFGTLVRKLGLRRDPNRLPLTEIQFNLEKLSDGVKFAGLDARLTPNPKAFTNFDIFFNVIESKDGLRLELDYATDLFDEETIARWVGHFRTLLAAIAEDSSAAIRDLPLLDAAQRQWLLHGLNETAFAYPKDRFLHELIAEQAARTPRKVAAAFDNVEITYASLDASSNRLAQHLRGLAPTPGARVAVAVERSLDMLTALIAVMKAGLAYVPVDPTQPAARLTQVLEAAKVSAVICSDDAMAALAPAGAQVVHLEKDAAAIAKLDATAPSPLARDTEAAAYVIFTSGSTGTPKGVEVSHRALVNFLSTMAQTPGFTADDVVMAVTTISFDIAGLELFLPLIRGGKVVICARDEVRDGFALVQKIEAANATMIQATPSLWRILLEAGFMARPGQKMLCGGEALPRDLADALIATGGDLWNVYGPTETTIWSSAGRVAPEGPVTIGEPIGNTQLYVVDKSDRLAAPGITGELLIGGDGLANGYFDRPDLTSAAFVTLELEAGVPQRLYRTGDMARRLADGRIQHLGRRDHQVKVRGFRIELEEVETMLRRQPGVAEAAAAVHQGPDGTGRLVGYYVPAGGAANPASLADGLSGALPEYMVPTLWVKLDALPLTQNGKLDRKALPAPDVAAADAAREIVAPRNAFEEQLAAIWRDVLKVEAVGIHDNIFALGADSLHVFRIAARMIQQGLGFEAKDLLKHPTIAELSAVKDSGQAGSPLASGPSLRDFRGGARRQRG
ncbi:MAG: amino acid adenylation domain-containing protein [Phenylobacterium sp.]|uniref:amino acid adenylation domain-containing protein n=1 Tax=Phenylobacterium sp. TaxID=1871053 RepID=UPI00391DBAA5